MTYKSHVQPLCRACGKPIKKETSKIFVYATPPRTEVPETSFKWENGKHVEYETGKMIPLHVPRHVIGTPHNKAEAQRLVNEKIVSVEYNRSDNVIDRVTVWDGESYVDKFFCSITTCAVNYAYMMAMEHGNRIQSVAYADALYLQQNGKPRK